MKIKILFVGLGDSLGGIEAFLINTCRNLDKEKFEISFLVFKGKKICYHDELRERGVKFFRITHRKENYIQFIQDLKNVYKNNHFDYIHLNLVNYSCYERITLFHKYNKGKIILHSHSTGGNNLGIKTKLLDSIGKFKTRKIDCLRIACGEEAGKAMFGKHRFTVINNGIDLEKFQYDIRFRNEIREELQIKKDEFVFGLVAMLEKVKNQSFLIDIFYEYQKLESNAKMILIGKGKLEESLKEQTRKLGIEDKVLFLGKRMDVYKIYSAMDIFVMPSLFEGLSVSIVEAQANGLKCYTSTGVDKDSDVTGNVTFLDLVEGARKWAEKIKHSDNKRDEQGITKIPKQFSLKENSKRLEEFYRESL